MSPDDIAHVSKTNYIFKCLYDIIYFPRCLKNISN